MFLTEKEMIIMLHPFIIDNLLSGLAQVFATTPELWEVHIVGVKQYEDLIAVHTQGAQDNWALLNTHPAVVEWLAEATAEMGLPKVNVIAL